jgi:hypothetical protein
LQPSISTKHLRKYTNNYYKRIIKKGKKLKVERGIDIPSLPSKSGILYPTIEA